MRFIKLLILSIVFVFTYIGPLQAITIAQLPDSSLVRETTSLKSSQDVLTVATFNVENLDPGDRRFEQIAKIIVNNLSTPDVLSLIEVQDNNGAINDNVVRANQTYQSLISAIEDIGGPKYAFTDIAPKDDQDGGEPGGNIRVGFLFQPQRVVLAKLPKGRASDAVAIRSSTDSIDLSFNPGRINPEDDAFDASRKPLAAEFLFNEQKLFLIANHFVSKRGGPPDDDKRVEQAQIVNQFVAQLLQSAPDANVVVMGDLNDLPDSRPLETIKGDILENLTERLPLSDQYTFEFKGELELIDYLLVSEHLARVAQPEIDIVHVNVGFKRSVSDHDPVLAAFTLPASRANLSTSRPQLSGSITTNSTTILPQLTSTLIEQIVEEYAPKATLNFDRARDQMFGIIDNQVGIVKDIYANYPIRLTGSIDPSKEADSLGLNTEHTWPQSKGADKGNAQSDLHHLFPARKNINSDRGNKPFSDIVDANTERWYRDDVALETIPNSAINQYSEWTSTQFEPREEVKGNVARAMFYFYTIYRDQADRVDASYFDRQSQTLCKWHQQDPADNAEVERNNAIAQFQGNENPFVLDATLAERVYCNS